MAQDNPPEGVHTHDLALNFVFDIDALHGAIRETLRQAWLCTSEYARHRAAPSASPAALLKAWGDVAEQLLIAAKTLERHHRAFAVNVPTLTNVLKEVDRAEEQAPRPATL